MSDIVERLRRLDVFCSDEGELCAAAADEIQTLRARVAELERERDDWKFGQEVAANLASAANDKYNELRAKLDALEPVLYMDCRTDVVGPEFRHTRKGYDTPLYDLKGIK